jgi:hypothetical protein
MVKAGRIGGHKKRKLRKPKSGEISKSEKRTQPKLLIPYNLIVPYLSLGGSRMYREKSKASYTKGAPKFPKSLQEPFLAWKQLFLLLWNKHE